MSFEGTIREKGPYPYLMTISGLCVTYEYSTTTHIIRETFSCSVSFAPNDIVGTLLIGDVYNSGNVRVYPNTIGWSNPFVATIMSAIYESLTEARNDF